MATFLLKWKLPQSTTEATASECWLGFHNSIYEPQRSKRTRRLNPRKLQRVSTPKPSCSIPMMPGYSFYFWSRDFALVIFRTLTSELSNSWPTCVGQGAVLLEKLGHVTPKVKSALWHGTGKLGTDSLWSRQFLCLVQMEVIRDLVQSHCWSGPWLGHVQKPYFAQE